MRISAMRVLPLALALAGFTGAASAQDTYQVNYFSNAWVGPDATVRIDNPGLTYGNLCAMVYVFAADQQMAECCGCIQSHNNLTTLSMDYNLDWNPLTGVPPSSGVIKIVSALPNSGGSCDPSATYTPTANLRAWATHVQNPVGASYPITETPFSGVTLGATELANLQAQCSFIGILGSGAGQCYCGSYF